MTVTTMVIPWGECLLKSLYVHMYAYAWACAHDCGCLELQLLGGCEPPQVGSGNRIGVPLEELQMLLTAEPSHQSPNLVKKKKSKHVLPTQPNWSTHC